MGTILVVNAGSTSLKLHAVEDDRKSTRVESFEDAPAGIDAVAHRVVHGGQRFLDPVVIDKEVREQIRELVTLAPLHNAPALEAIDAAQRALPQVPHVAVFDTSFHRTIPAEAAEYAKMVGADPRGPRFSERQAQAQLREQLDRARAAALAVPHGFFGRAAGDCGRGPSRRRVHGRDR